MARGNTSDLQGPNNRSFDAIVIGSGMGALAFSSLMARLRKWRVLVLERHFKIGDSPTPSAARAAGPGMWAFTTWAKWPRDRPGGACSISSRMEEWTGRPCRMSMMCLSIRSSR